MRVNERTKAKPYLFNGMIRVNLSQYSKVSSTKDGSIPQIVDITFGELIAIVEDVQKFYVQNNSKRNSKK
jgi:hypothetical protein